MLSVFPVLYLERAAIGYFAGLSLLFIWATIEELFKFGAAYITALRTRVFDEPLDAVIYMVTAALGFSAMENVLFLLTPLYEGDVVRTLVTGDLRFIGATLLHTLASAVIGMCLALAFYKSAGVRRLAGVIGVILAIALHTVFNFFILGKGSGATFWVFLCIWLGVAVLLILIERIKQPTRDYC
jgi:RsiW-degrading membrane proteinase PrsW (M82 family)